jgi:hypothetical protein
VFSRVRILPLIRFAVLSKRSQFRYLAFYFVGLAVAAAEPISGLTSCRSAGDIRVAFNDRVYPFAAVATFLAAFFAAGAVSRAARTASTVVNAIKIIRSETGQVEP